MMEVLPFKNKKGNLLKCACTQYLVGTVMKKHQ